MFEYQFTNDKVYIIEVTTGICCCCHQIVEKKTKIAEVTPEQYEEMIRIRREHELELFGF